MVSRDCFRRFFGVLHAFAIFGQIVIHKGVFDFGIVKLWLAGGCKQTPEEMESIIRSEYRGRDEFERLGDAPRSVGGNIPAMP